MPEMKDSSIFWIGKIPKTWKVDRIKYLPNKELNSFIDGDWIDSPYITETGIRYLTTGNIGDGYFKRQGNGYISEETFKLLGCTFAYPGDLVFSRLNAPFGRSCILPNDEDRYVLAVDNVILRTNDSKQYLCYVSQCMGFQNSVCDVAAGTTMKRVSRTNLGNIKIPRPPLSVQQSIANFLDQKCSEIDSLSADIQSQIDILEEYKKSVITETVTKGLNPDVKMKDSGIDIVGMIPVDWNVVRLRYLCTIQTGDSDTQDADAEGIYPFYVRSPVVEKSKTYTFDGEGILVAGDGAGAGRVFHHAHGKYAVHQRVYRLANFKNINSNFLFFYLQNLFAKQMDKGSAQSTVPSLRLPMLLNFAVCIPTLKAQEEIADYLDTKCAEINSIIADKKAQLETLAEYKKSLIYEYVTGKKEVKINE